MSATCAAGAHERQVSGAPAPAHHNKRALDHSGKSEQQKKGIDNPTTFFAKVMRRRTARGRSERSARTEGRSPRGWVGDQPTRTGFALFTC